MRFLSSRPLLLLRHIVRRVESDGLRETLAHISDRISASLRNHGIGGSVTRTFRQSEAQPQVTAEEPQASLAPHPFDLLHGTDTSGCLASSVLPPTSLSALYITGYTAIGPSALTQALAALPIQHRDFSFVDLGCGKGRALMVATQFPFRRLLGVELDPELCRIAEANIVTRAEWAARISILEHDAATVQLPDGPLVLFMFHPFFARILRRVLANVERQYDHSPREIWLLYAYNRFPEVLRRFPFLQPVSDHQYMHSPEDAAASDFELPYELFTLYRAGPKP